MASDILENFSGVTALTITLASLASSAAGVGRQGTVVDNATTKYPRYFVAASIKLGTSPGANTAVMVYAIRSNADTTAILDDGAGASDAAWTRKSAGSMIYSDGRPSTLFAGTAPATGDVLSGNFILPNPGKKWAPGVVQNTTVALNGTGSNHVMSYYGDDPQAQ